MNNTTAVGYARDFGGAKSGGPRDKTLQYWGIVLDRDSWVIPSRIAGEDNVMADFFSRHTIAHQEFSLISSVF